MKNEEVEHIFNAQLSFGRTPKGRSLSPNGESALKASLSDTKNMSQDALKCINCGIIMSSLLVGSGCPNCGGSDMTTEIKAEDIF